MGLAAAGTVAIAVLIAITLLPALLGFAGHAHGARRTACSLPAARAARRGRDDGERALGALRHPPPAGRAASSAWRCWPCVAIPATHMKLGLPDGGSEPTDDDRAPLVRPAHRGLRPGLQRPADRRRRRAGARRASSRSSSRKDVAAGRSRSFPGVAAVSPPMQNEAGDLTIVQVTPDDRPGVRRDAGTSSRASATRPTSSPSGTGIAAYVTGTTALNIDTADRLAAALPMYIAVVVGLALLLLMVVFRSILVPIKAAAGFLLSIAASMGARRLDLPGRQPRRPVRRRARPARSSASCRSC